jgi:hypothetical protein
MGIGTQIAGFFADYLKIKGWLTVTQIRKYFILINFMIQATFLIILSYESDPIKCVIYLVLSVAAGSFTSSGLFDLRC